MPARQPLSGSHVMPGPCEQGKDEREARMGSFNKRLYCALLMLLMCSAALAFFLLIWSLDTRAKVSAFASEGTVTQGVVLDKAWSYKASTASHKVQVRFVDLDGVERTNWI